MKRYLMLTHFEFTRFRFIYFSLFIITLLSQFGGLYIYAYSTLRGFHDSMVRYSLSETEFVQQFGTISFSNYLDTLWFMAPIALSVAALLLYVFMIWYRDWLGKNMFIYRLLMLPTPRINIFLAKCSTILLSVLGLVGFQLLVLPLQVQMFNALIPSIFRDPVSVYHAILSHPLLQILIPQTFIEFVLYYGLGTLGVIVVFTAILMERSYRWKGLMAGIVYTALACFIFFLPLIITETYGGYLYPVELLLTVSAVGIFIACASLWLSHFLLKNKVSV